MKNFQKEYPLQTNSQHNYDVRALLAGSELSEFLFDRPFEAGIFIFVSSIVRSFKIYSVLLDGLILLKSITKK